MRLLICVRVCSIVSSDCSVLPAQHDHMEILDAVRVGCVILVMRALDAPASGAYRMLTVLHSAHTVRHLIGTMHSEETEV